MDSKEHDSSSAAKPSIAELTERIQEQSVKDQPDGILETTTKPNTKPAKQKKQSGEKSGKQAQLGEGKAGKKAQAKSDTGDKKSKKRIEGAALIGIDVAKEADFPDWYQQVASMSCNCSYSAYTETRY